MGLFPPFRSLCQRKGGCAMKSVRKVLLGVLVLGVLCFSLLATAPWDAGIAPMTPYTIPLGVAELYDTP